MKDAFPSAFRSFLLLVAGALAVAAARELLDALSGPGVPALWWSARALGLVAYLALALSTLFGVMVSAKGAGGLLDKATVVARVLTVVYFLFFLLMPWYTARDKTKPVPARVVWK